VQLAKHFTSTYSSITEILLDADPNLTTDFFIFLGYITFSITDVILY